MSIKNEMRLDFPALGENEAFARMAISAFLLPLNPTIEELADVKTAVSEAVTNAIVHGYAGGRGTVRMHAYYTDETVLTVDIIDRGCGIADIEHAREPFYTTAPGDERSGMGFTIMESFMDKQKVNSTPGKGTTVTMLRTIRQRRGFR